jgi:hypothetical protein
MRRILKFLLLVFLLNSIRYAAGWPLERLFIHEKLTAAMENNADIFNSQFTGFDWAAFFFVNFAMWFLISLIYVKIEPLVHGHPMRKSLKVYGVMFLFFVAISALYMNQYSHPSDFYVYNILDGMLIFPLVALANGLIHPRLFKDSTAQQKHARQHAPAHSPLAGHFPATPHGSPDPSGGLHRL